MTDEQILRIYIETPSGDRFEADMLCRTKVGEIARDFFEAQGWPTADRHGRGQKAVMELVDPTNPDHTLRLNLEKEICESGLRNGDTLRIIPEFTAAGPDPFSNKIMMRLNNSVKNKNILRLNIEAPSGERFEADIPALAKVSQVASDFFEAGGWPISDRHGRSQKAVVELVDPENPDNIKRLSSDKDIYESGLRNGDTLRITPLSRSSYPLFSGKTEMWLDDGIQVHNHIRRASKKLIRHVAWSPDSEVLASASTDGEIRLWDMRKKRDAGDTDMIPPLLCTLPTDYEDTITSIVWSPDSKMLASASTDETVCLWDTRSRRLFLTLSGHQGIVNSVAWSPDSKILASASTDRTICLWDTENGQLLHMLTGHQDAINGVAWSPDGKMLASASNDRTICLWDRDTRQLLHTFKGHKRIVNSVVWSPDGTILVSAAEDNTIRLWNIPSRKIQHILEGFTDIIDYLSFSFDGRFLVSKSLNGTLRLWRSDIWKGVEIVRETPLNGDMTPADRFPGFAFHPQALAIASPGDGNTAIYILHLNLEKILNISFASYLAQSSVNYANARVVVLGDTGVGKTGLSLVLTGQPFMPTTSTHGRHVWVLDNREELLDEEHTETQEILLWDLAGQPGYRLIHQLHLNEAAIALVIFDARNEVDPFAGVYYWSRAISQAQRVNGSTLPLKKFLVAARIDREGIGVSRQRIESLVSEFGFDGYFETSAQEGQKISPLLMAIRKSVDWSVILKITSTHLFLQIKGFLIAEKNSGRLLCLIGDLYHAFLRSKDAPDETDELREQFEICTRLAESQGLIRRLHRGNCVLLQPELLDIYASALVNAVKNEPDGMGIIVEDQVREANFFIPTDVRLKDKRQENFLLISMVEDLLRQEIILREQIDNKVYLIFPSQSSHEKMDMPVASHKTVIFSFEGSVLYIYATLVVRLSQSGIFKKKEIGKNAVTYVTKTGGTYGILLENSGEGRGDLTLYCDNTSKEMRFYFEDFVYEHLKQKILLEKITKKRIYICSKEDCKIIIPNYMVELRLKRNLDWLACPVCETRVYLINEEEIFKDIVTTVSQMNKDADERRDSIVQAFVFQTLQHIPTITFRKVDEKEGEAQGNGG